MGDNTGGSKHYPVVDIRNSTSPSVVGHRRISPVGACIHHTDGTNSRDWLTGGSAKAGTPASADILIASDGKRFAITRSDQYAFGVGSTSSHLKQLFAAGNSNEYLLSVEIEYRSIEAPTFAQVDSCAEQIVNWAFEWGWRWPFVIYGHYGIAAPIGRKSDPYNFDWGSFMGRLYLHSLVRKVPGLIVP